MENSSAKFIKLQENMRCHSLKISYTMNTIAVFRISHTFKMGLFAKIVNTLLLFCLHGSIFDVWLRSQYISPHTSERVWGLLSLGFALICLCCFLCICFMFFRWGNHLNMSLFPSVRPSIHPSVSCHISGTVHYMIMIFGVHVHFFHFFKITKNSPKWKIQMTSVTHYISGTVEHMIMIYVTLV